MFTTALFIVIPLFAIYRQTIRNLLAFMALVFVVSINLMIHLAIEFFPIFFMLVYIGAIVVTVLFVVLTFDLRAEYNKKIYEPRGLFNSSLYLIVTGVLCFSGISYKKIL